ncbi:MAG TPA: hypothetical protein VKB50_32400 [Vicinamibacterales bacterium]|nr:hypothetical protein [Vicinamibacterales bacterium]
MSKSKSQSKSQSKKHVGDVLGISSTRFRADRPRATKDRGGNPKGIELPRRRSTMRPARVVGGVRGRGH